MRNAYAIADLSELMQKSCTVISSAALSINNAEQNDNKSLCESYKGIMLNELENLQHLVISLTACVTDVAATAANYDEAGTAFQQGELNDDLGDKTEPRPAITEEEEK